MINWISCPSFPEFRIQFLFSLTYTNHSMFWNEEPKNEWIRMTVAAALLDNDGDNVF